MNTKWQPIVLIVGSLPLGVVGVHSSPNFLFLSGFALGAGIVMLLVNMID